VGLISSTDGGFHCRSGQESSSLTVLRIAGASWATRPQWRFRRLS